MAGERKPRRGCCLGCLAAALSPVLLVACVYWFNNRSQPDVIIPRPPMPALNGFTEIVKAAQMLKPRRRPFPIDLTAEVLVHYTSADGAAAYKDARPALAMVHSALGLTFQHPVIRSLDEDRTAQRDWHHLRAIIHASYGAAHYAFTTGRYDEAMAYAADCYEMGVVIRHGGDMDADAVGEIACSYSLRVLEPLVRRLGARQLGNLDRRLDRIASRWTPFGDTVLEQGRQDVCLNRDESRTLAFRDNGAGGRTFWRYAEMQDPQGSDRAHAIAAARLVLGDKQAMLRENLAFWEALSRELSGPYTGHIRTHIPSNPLMGWKRELLEHMLQHHMKAVACFAVLRAEVALERYRLDHGRYPASLRELVPAYAKTLPEDPCAGKPGVPLCHFPRTGGKAYLLYSVGPDMHDDGGRPGRIPYDPGDVVAGRLTYF